VCGINLLDCTVTTQLQRLLHRGESWVAIDESGQLQNTLGISRLSKSSPDAVLMHLDSQVEGERAEITHLEGGLHFLLESLHVVVLGSSDDQVVDVDAHQ
jgi:hypothetical protein